MSAAGETFRAFARCRMVGLWGALVPLILAGRVASQPPDAPAPTHANVAYGPHSQQVVDLYLAPSDRPAPLVVFIHGCGFYGGSKNQVSAEDVRRLLEAGISVASVEYRFIAHAPLPAAHEDARRALQFLRSQTGEWNIDRTRIAGQGGSAGAQLALWLAFHDDMADPAATDPVARESTRLTCAAVNGAQTTMDMDLWEAWLPAGYARHRDARQDYGTTSEQAIRQAVQEISVINHASADDPPVFLRYGMAPDGAPPGDPAARRSWYVHHVNFGFRLKARLDTLGVEAHVSWPGAAPRYQSAVEFLIAKLRGR